jgi:hypothetical protein
MRFWLCLVLAACHADFAPPTVTASPPLAAPKAATAPLDDSRVASPPVASPPVAPRPASPLPAAAHSADIVALGVTPDGGVVASADRLGGMRLWTTLDGTREPVVIHGTAPRSIAVVRDGDGFTIGTLDAAGGVHVIRTGAAGAVRERITVGGGPAAELDASEQGLLVLRADQTIELIDPRGAVRSRLVADAGTHIDSILVRGRRALALIQDGRQLRGRRIVLDGEARWGDATPSFAIKFAHAVLSPDGDRLAVTQPRGLLPALIDLATGKPLPEALCVSKGWPEEHGISNRQFVRGENAPTPLGFVTSTVVACSVVGNLQWWLTSGVPDEPTTGSFVVGGLPVAVSDRGLIAGVSGNLAISSPTLTKFLGYGAHDISQMRVAADGVLVSGSDQQSLVLDAALRERARFDLGRFRVEWTDVAPIDDRWAIVALYRRHSSRREGVSVAVIDGITRAQHQLLPYDVRDRELTFERTTGLLALSDGGATLLLRFDPQTHTFGAPVRLASAITPTKIALLDPSLTGGVAALAIDSIGPGQLIGEIHLADLRPGTVVQPRTTYRVPGELRAVDRAGRVYMRGEGDDVVIHTRGVAGTRLADAGALTLRPSPDGSQVAAFQAPRLVLMSTATGEIRWDVSHWSSADVAWLSSSDLVLQFPSAVARVDLETGALAEKRCGLAFGLSDQLMHARLSGGPTICEAAR